MVRWRVTYGVTSEIRYTQAQSSEGLIIYEQEYTLGTSKNELCQIEIVPSSFEKNDEPWFDGRSRLFRPGKEG